MRLKQDINLAMLVGHAALDFHRAVVALENGRQLVDLVFPHLNLVELQCKPVIPRWLPTSVAIDSMANKSAFFIFAWNFSSVTSALTPQRLGWTH